MCVNDTNFYRMERQERLQVLLTYTVGEPREGA